MGSRLSRDVGLGEVSGNARILTHMTTIKPWLLCVVKYLRQTEANRSLFIASLYFQSTNVSLPSLLHAGVFVFSPFKNHPVQCGHSGLLVGGPDPECYGALG